MRRAVLVLAGFANRLEAVTHMIKSFGLIFVSVQNTKAMQPGE
jgi:hypothetical protein